MKFLDDFTSLTLKLRSGDHMETLGRRLMGREKEPNESPPTFSTNCRKTPKALISVRVLCYFRRQFLRSICTSTAHTRTHGSSIRSSKFQFPFINGNLEEGRQHDHTYVQVTAPPLSTNSFADNGGISPAQAPLGREDKVYTKIILHSHHVPTGPLLTLPVEN